MERVSLCGEWKLAVLPHKQSIECTGSKEIFDLNVKVISAKVPGNLETDLEAAGEVDDLFFGTNPDKIRRYTETLHCYYFKKFNINELIGTHTLCFDGLDCYADVFVNEIKVASFDNMLIKQTCNIDDALKIGENELFVHIKPAVIEALKYEYPFILNAGPSAYEQLYVRKPAHMYGWDIMPRYVSAGIWKPVYIETETKNEKIDEIFLCASKLYENVATLELQYKTKCDISGDIKLRLCGKCKDSVIEKEIPLVFPYGRKSFTVENPYLWWPRGFGEPDLYEFVLSLIRDGKIIDEVKFYQGIRTVKLNYSDVIDDDGNGEFVFNVNNNKIFIKGSNWVAASPFHSKDIERIPDMIKLAEELNCNMLRCWGGNVYEDELFYELCDKAGIMIWQDFCLACNSCPQDEAFIKRIQTETIQVVKRLRMHPCIALWSGDNESDLSWISREGVNPENNIVSRKVLPQVVLHYNPTTSYLPSSPYISSRLFDITTKEKGGNWGETLRYTPEFHDYLWSGYYKQAFLRNTRSRFISEFGSMGTPSPESLKKYISPEKLWPYNENNDEWRMHATTAIPELSENNFRLKIFFDQLLTIFDKEPESLADFAVKSQITQGEHLKYYLELFRAERWSKTGIIWWNLIDGWPQFSDAVVDYYYDKKKAFYDLKASQQDVCLIVTDSKDGISHKLVAANDTLTDVSFKYIVRDMDSDEILAEGTASAEKNQSTVIAEIPTSPHTRFILIEWSGDVSGKNHYLDIQQNKEKISKERYINWLEKADMYKEWVEKIKKW